MRLGTWRVVYGMPLYRLISMRDFYQFPRIVTTREIRNGAVQCENTSIPWILSYSTITLARRNANSCEHFRENSIFLCAVFANTWVQINAQYARWYIGLRQAIHVAALTSISNIVTVFVNHYNKYPSKYPK